jgi:hypothetical protein
MADEEKPIEFLWKRVRGQKRSELDRLERELVKRPGEARKFAGDPNQPRVFWVKTRVK